MQIIILYKFMNISIIMHYELIFMQWFAAFERVAENLVA